MDSSNKNDEQIRRITSVFNNMCKRINEDPDNVIVTIEMTHDATELDEVDGVRQFIEGNRGYILRVKENRPRSFYTNLHNSKK